MKINLNKIKEFLKKLPEILASHVFLTFLGFLFISLIIGIIIFYQQKILIERGILKVVEKPLEFEQKTYQKVLDIWREREKRFKETDFKKYLNPFYSTFQLIEEKPELEPELELELEPEKVPELTPEPEIILKLPDQKIKKLQAATTLEEFYKIKEERLPSIKERAKIWQEKNLGLVEEYFGTFYQNIRLLNELKKRL